MPIFFAKRTICLTLVLLGAGANASVLPAAREKVRLETPASGVILRSFTSPCTISKGSIGEPDFKAIVIRQDANAKMDAIQVLHVNFKVGDETCELFFGRTVDAHSEGEYALLGNIHLNDGFLSVEYKGGQTTAETLEELAMKLAKSSESGAEPLLNVSISRESP